MLIFSVWLLFLCFVVCRVLQVIDSFEPIADDKTSEVLVTGA